jgi:hypothetical protein
MTTPTNTISTDAVLTTVVDFVAEFKRPCPSSFLTGKYGDDVLDVVDSLKASGILLGLRGRNGGLALHGSDIVAKRAEHAIKKAAKAAKPVPGLEVTEAAEQTDSPDA